LLLYSIVFVFPLIEWY